MKIANDRQRRLEFLVKNGLSWKIYAKKVYLFFFSF